MRLNYSILWIEDSSDWAESIQERISEIVESYGLFASFTILPAESDEQKYNGYNLILMDLGLAEGRQVHGREDGGGYQVCGRQGGGSCCRSACQQGCTGGNQSSAGGL